MYEISEFGIEVKQADSEVIELICLMGLANQTNQEKYELIKPFFERLNLYCDEFCLRLEKDTDLFAIPLSTIDYVEYEEVGDVLFILFKKNRHLHSFNINLKIHTIYIIKEKHNCIFEFFLNIYNRIRIIFIGYRLKRKTAKYIKRLILNNNSETDS